LATGTFQRNLESGNWDSWQPYTAQKGDRPEAIAKRFGISVDRLLEHNPIPLKRGKLQRAQTILVPVNRRGGSATEAHASGAHVSDASRHVVQRGDTLFGVARRYGLSVAQLSAANPELASQIQPGQTIRLTSTEPASRDTRAIQPVSLKASVGKPAGPVHYTVRRGDTLFSIAQRFDTSLADIKAWNPVLDRHNTIRAGQTVVVKQP
jgi:membrane-bound lytic murein transglycosylase D